MSCCEIFFLGGGRQKKIKRVICIKPCRPAEFGNIGGRADPLRNTSDSFNNKAHLTCLALTVEIFIENLAPKVVAIGTMSLFALHV